MTKKIKSKAATTAKSAAPWRKGIPWWLVLLEGIILTGVGLYMFFAKPSTLAILGWILALVLLAAGAMSLYLVSQVAEKSAARKFTLIQGGVAAAAGGLVVILRLFNALSAETAAIVLGLGCLVYGGMGLYTLIDPHLVPLRRVSIISAVFFTVIGVLLLLEAAGVGTVATIVLFITLAVLIAGIALILWSFALKNSAAA